VQELRAALAAQVLQRGDQRIEVVAVDRADVVEAEFLEHRARHDHALGVLSKRRPARTAAARSSARLGAFAARGVELPLISRAR
jgi:hypothetical protein